RPAGRKDRGEGPDHGHCPVGRQCRSGPVRRHHRGSVPRHGVTQTGLACLWGRRLDSTPIKGESAMTKATDLAAMIGTEVGRSKWFEIDQKRIDVFADATEDWQFIHVDPEAAKQTPFGGTIAHGFLTLS